MSDDQVYYAIRYTTGKNKGKFVRNGAMGCLAAVDDATDACSRGKYAWFRKDSRFSKGFELVKIKLTIEPVVGE